MQDYARRGLVTASLGMLALAAIIVARESVGYRRGSSNEVALEQQAGGDPFLQELSALAPHATAAVERKVAAQRSNAEQLLARARQEMKSRGPEIDKLLRHSEALDARLAQQQAAEQRMGKDVEAAQKRVDDLKRKDAKLHMTIGWPQRGGAMPTTYPSFDEAPSLQVEEDTGVDAAAIKAAAEAIAKAYAAQQQQEKPAAPEDMEGGPLRVEDFDAGVDAAGVQAAAKNIAQAYAARASGGIEEGSPEDWNGDSLRPGRVQRTTSRHGEGADDEWSNWLRREADAGYPTSNGEPYDPYNDKPVDVMVVDGPGGWGTHVAGSREVPMVRAPWDGGASSGADVDTPDVQRVKKLMDIQKTKSDLKEQETDLEDQVFADAQNGKLSNQQLPEDAKVFSEGFIQGAVEASKKSVEQQGKFAKQLEKQGEIVKQLEDLVHELEEKQRKENFDKTAAAVEAPAPAPAPAAPPAPEVAEAVPAAPKPGKGDKKIQIDFYMEAECPGCKAFTTGLLTDTLNAVGDWVDLRVIPYGNANLNNSIIECQHGPDECIGNKIELCMMKKYGKGGDWKAWYPAFKCIEASDDSPENASKTCLPDSGMDKQAIIDCAKSNEGDLLHMAAAQMTIDLDPPHKWTPWVVMDGKPLEDKTEDILKEVCGKIPASAKKAIAQCNPVFKAKKGASSLAARRPRIQKCYPDDPLSELVLGIH
jgi:interferon gamma-inducible protein 30